MQGFIELLTAVAILVWVIGPVTRRQYEKERYENPPDGLREDDRVLRAERVDDPLVSHPYFRAERSRWGIRL